MHGLNLLTAASHVVRLAGQTCRLGVLTLADYGEIENRIADARPDPMADAAGRLAGLSPDERRAELGRLYDRAAARRRVTLADLDRWWPTPEAVVYRLWLMLRKDQPRLTLEAAEELFCQAGVEQRAAVVARMAECQGWPESGQKSAPPSHTDDDVPALPWYRWAAELSRAYGWSPAEIGRLTIVQMTIYLGQAGESADRRRMDGTAAVALCQSRRRDRQQWIERMMEDQSHGA